MSKKMILRMTAVVLCAALTFGIFAVCAPRTTVSTKAGADTAHASSSVTTEEAEAPAAAQTETKAAVTTSPVTPAVNTVTSGAKTELVADEKQYPTIILPGINHSVSYLANSDGTVVKDSKGNDLSAGLLIVDTSNLVKDILGKVALPLLTSLLTGKDEGLSDGVKATLSDLFHVQKADKTGTPVNNLITKKYEYPVSQMDSDTKSWFYRMLPVQEYANLVGEDMIYMYTFPLIGDPMASAEGLKDYIELVKQQRGVDKVNLLSVSLGGTILTAYAEAVNGDFSNINRIVGVVSLYDGTDIMADFYGRNWNLTDDFFYNQYLPSVLEANDMSTFQVYAIDSLVAIMPKSVRDTILTAAMDSFLDDLMINDAQFWAMVPSSKYEELADRYLSGSDYAVLRAKTDKFQQARLDLKANLTAARDNYGVLTSTISGYDLTYTDGEYNFFGIVASSATANSDAIIPAVSTSLGATTAPAKTKLDASYLASADPDYVSPDKSLDASTCLFPDNAWFFCGQHHEIGKNDAALKLAANILTGGIDNVNTAPDRFPQFNGTRNTKQLTRSYLAEAQTVMANADGKYTAAQIADVTDAYNECVAMMDDTICDSSYTQECIDFMRAALVECGVETEPASSSKKDEILGSLAEYIYDLIYKYNVAKAA